ncbi:hypothetical protein [Algibacillus agarilyticus]|uniref:hypothetical protein n=1 Tax=Algibacillus agarilyticus TaxID=2234133 RepID=UPI000DCF7BAE|nr:hypothetical protein [Algibacillus agarilyticus]
MRLLMLGLISTTLTACVLTNESTISTHGLITENEPETQVTQACIGSVGLPAHLKNSMVKAQDTTLLNNSIGEPNAGKLCQGQVYETTQAITLFRAWNSTNPNSQLGRWWAHSKPTGLVADYRQDYEICYQWSPLDVMSTCTLKAGVKVVLGTGQSAQCSEYLTYPVSDAQQIYIENASELLEKCETKQGVFAWE